MSLTQVTSDVISTNTISGLISLGFNTLNVANIQVQTVDSGTGNTLVFRANTAERMRIGPTGNVGIGTTNPTANLHISSIGSVQILLEADTDNITESHNPSIRFSQDAGAVIGRVGYAAGTNTFEVVNQYAEALIFGTTNTERMRIDSSGNIGIATTAPAQRLQIGLSGANNYIQFGTTNEGYVIGRENASGDFIFDATQVSPYNVFKWRQSGTERMRIAADGSVGIGTSSPSTPLHVNGTITATSVNTNNTFGFKNRIINGAMVIDQRNAGSSVTPTASAYTLDRWQFQCTQASKVRLQRLSSAVNGPVGFQNYLAMTSLSAYSVLAGDFFALRQAIEGFNMADLQWGTANAKTVTLSFWVNCTLTGTFGGSIVNDANNRSYPFTYTISAANAWEQKTITIAGDTTGTWVGATNGEGLNLFLGLGAGATYSGTAGAWSAGNYVTATGATSVVGTNGAVLYLTGVQLEVGESATSFDYRPYGTELALCQRYFWYLAGANAAGDQYLGAGMCNSTTQARFSIQFPVGMRASPTVSFGTASNYQVFSGAISPNLTSGAIAGISTSTTEVISVGLLASVSSGLTAGSGAVLLGVNTSAKLTFSSEL